MLEKIQDIFFVVLVWAGVFIVLGSVGGMETDTINLAQGTYCSLGGFALIAIAIRIGNRREKG